MNASRRSAFPSPAPPFHKAVIVVLRACAGIACIGGALVQRLDSQQRRAAEEGLSEDELALFDLLSNDGVRVTQVLMRANF